MNTYIVIGLSAAGISALNHLRNLDPQATIIGIADQAELPYNKCVLVDYCMDLKTLDELTIFTHELAQKKNIQLLLSTRVERIAPQEHSIELFDGTVLTYTKLFIATGTSPFIPPISGVGKGNGVFTFHTLSDADAICNYVKCHTIKKAVVIGAGLSGLECADALRTKSVQVAVVEQAAHVLPKAISSACSDYIQKAMASHNAVFYGNTQIKQILYEQGRVVGVLCSDGQLIDAELVIIAAGTRPNSQLASLAGIALHNGGISTNEYMQTNIPTIYAGGDVAVVKDQLTGFAIQSCMWPDAMYQGMVAAHAMAGKPRAYPGAFPMLSSAFFGLKFASCGPVGSLPEGAEVVTRSLEGSLYTFAFKEGSLIGFVLVGDITPATRLKRALMTGEILSKEAITAAF